jgi:N-acetylneuraminic acid mutarotase
MRTTIMKSARNAILLLLFVSVSLFLAACGGGSSSGTSNPPPPVTYTIGGTVSGLAGSGLVLQNNGGDNLTVSASGSFTFKTAMASGGSYKVTVLTQPSTPAQTCTVTGGTGTASANVTSVQVACTTTTFTIGGSVSGLAGSGLVLQNNGGDNLAVSANGSFTFKTAIASGASYSVTVLTQPSTPAQICTVTGGTGTASANVTSVQVACTTTTFTIGGTVINLVGTGGGLVLQDNGGDNLLVNANGAFTFATPLDSGAGYAVTIHTQPSTPAQSCAVTNGAGTATANVTTVKVDCGHNQWTWIGGPNLVNQKGTYGTQGTAAASNIPGARSNGATWTDASGAFWFFGGIGLDSNGTPNVLNDLWKYSGGQWTWMAGSNLSSQQGTYGTQGTAAAANIPGARLGGVTWTDKAGNVWLFGGTGNDSVGNNGQLNDLWVYSNGQWTWMGGSNLVGQKGTYGTQGTAAASNVPGARSSGVAWTDASGAFWLFGGNGLDSSGTYGYLNDLWKYSGGQWTWMGGSKFVGREGTYGTRGTASAGNAPGARGGSVAWTEPSGTFWLFGGNGLDSNGVSGGLNDLWEYTGGQWTWMGGSNLVNQQGTYGTQGTASAGNVPGARFEAVSWTDKAGNLWLYGGYGFDSNGTISFLGDLWRFSNGQWTWVSGSNLTGQMGIYGTLGTSNPANIPGDRLAPMTWIDANGNVWLFGGQGMASIPTIGSLNDLWMYEP